MSWRLALPSLQAVALPQAPARAARDRAYPAPRDGSQMSRVHLLVDGYRRIACGDGGGVPSGDDDHSFRMYEAMTEAIAVRLVELGETNE